MKANKFYFLVSLLLFLTNCSPKYPFCINEKTESLKIEWGTIYLNSKEEERFILFSNGDLFKEVSLKGKKKMSHLDEQKFCNVLTNVQNTILKTQVINEVGDTLNFVEYINPALGIFISARWNPRFKTKNSIHFRQLYDSLKVLTLEIKN
ncbi:MAG: hypothetical protein ACP5LT_06330 [Candidatus Kapaibacteriota bacterium]